ncbi:glutaminase A [Pontibacillus yanchengensis]|uniref:Glutaminase n=1 Tax=Pontibacillus yanchengensis Y32 TaxID=1385514 RepID=A0A0A2TQA0_9BACI|nr:glutaminase A [Pontibacillus yanchengensis]KGP71475.1 glutaminase [Pontibacillus yanchengensis Y32]
MRKKVNQHQLEGWINHVQSFTHLGKVPDYIPALAKQNPENIAISIVHLNGECIKAGNLEHTFTLQSISKVISLALALMDQGEDYVFSKVGMEPTGDPFHSIAKLETSNPSKPLNPMINAGALAVTNMVEGSTPDQKVGRLLSFVHELAGDNSITYDEEVASSEFKTSFLNRSLSFFMKQTGVVEGSVEELLDTYTKQCAIDVNIQQLARIGAVFANEGKDLETGRQIIPQHYARICKTFMVTCGMYDASGSFAIRVGIPAKSGVSGAIMGAHKDLGGIAVFGPALDEKGNSVVGMHLLEMLANREDLFIF